VAVALATTRAKAVRHDHAWGGGAVVWHMWCGMAAIAVGESCVGICVATTEDDGTVGWDDDGRRVGSAVVTTSRGAIGGGASSAWEVAWVEHDDKSYLK
jgi:hypothetical protein